MSRSMRRAQGAARQAGCSGYVSEETEALLQSFKDVGEALKATQDDKGNANDDKDKVDIHAVCLDLKEKDMIPSVLFRIDAARCRELL